MNKQKLSKAYDRFRGNCRSPNMQNRCTSVNSFTWMLPWQVRTRNLLDERSVDELGILSSTSILIQRILGAVPFSIYAVPRCYNPRIKCVGYLYFGLGPSDCMHLPSPLMRIVNGQSTFLKNVNKTKDNYACVQSQLVKLKHLTRSGTDCLAK